MIGYLLLQAFENALPGQQVVGLITQTLVAADDPAFGNPTKFVRPVDSQSEANKLAERWGSGIRLDGQRWRRVVPSPEPQGIIELATIRVLLGDGAVVICAGGGGVPVRRTPDGQLQGVEAVVDKDSTTALLAQNLELPTHCSSSRTYRRSSWTTGSQAPAPSIASVPLSSRQCNFRWARRAPKWPPHVDSYAVLGVSRPLACWLADAEKLLDGTAGTMIYDGTPQSEARTGDTP